MADKEKRRSRVRAGGEAVRRKLKERPHIRPAVYGYLTEEKESLRQGFAALFLSSTGELVAGIALAGIAGILDELVGLAVLIPAAIGMRGAIFGAMGSRLSTAIQTGLFSFNLRRGVLAENLQAAAVLSLISGVFLAFMARLLCDFLGVRTELSVFDYVVISTVGGAIAGVLLLGITVVVARLSVARGWDMDNIASLRRILAESLPILAMTGTVTIIVGVALEDRKASFVALPALFILLPAFLQEGGALGGILSSRLSSKIHLGLLAPRGLPPVNTFRDFTLIYTFATGVYLFIGGASHWLAVALGQLSPDLLARLGLDADQLSPGFLVMLGVSALAGLIATTAAALAAYYGSIVSYRVGLDPDTYGIPIITAAVDLLGFMSLIIALIVFGLVG
jgi:mgtE-like transporter